MKAKLSYNGLNIINNTSNKYIFNNIKLFNSFNYINKKQHFYKLFNQNLTTTVLHGHKRVDKFDIIQKDESQQERIIKRERNIFSKWKKLINSTYKEWEAELHLRELDPNSEDNNTYKGEEIGNYLYYNKLHPTKGYEIFYRKRLNNNSSSNSKKQNSSLYGQENNEEELVFDIGKVPYLKNMKKASLNSINISEDESRAAFVIDLNNDEKTISGLYDIGKNLFLPIVFSNSSSIDFGNTSDELISLEYEGSEIRPSKIVYYNIKNEIKNLYDSKIKNNLSIQEMVESELYNRIKQNSKILFLTNNKEEVVEMKKTKNNEYAIVNIVSKNDTETNLICLKSLKVIQFIEKVKDVMFYVDYSDGVFYLISNINKPQVNKANTIYNEFNLYSIKEDDIKSNNNKMNISKLKLLLVPEENEFIEDMQVFKENIVLYSKHNMIPTVILYNIATKTTKRYNINNQSGVISPGVNKDFKAKGIKFSYSNPFIMNNNYYLDFNSNDKTDLKLLSSVNFSPKNINISDYNLEVIDCPSKDGEIVPCTLFYNNKLHNLKKSSSNLNYNNFSTYEINFNNAPFNNTKYLNATNSLSGLKSLTNMKRKNKILLIGYGAYGLNHELMYDSVLLAAVEKGWIIAFAHIRGGYEKGKYWHDKGKLLNKMNSIIDYESVIFELVRQGIAHPNYITAYGASAGAAVVAQVINRNPSLIRAAILSHPFLDVLGELMNDKYRLTVTDYKEFGNPIKSKEDYFNILGWSPYENIAVKEYPAMFITLSKNDSRVNLFGVLKYIEKLRLKALPPNERLPDFIEGSKNIVVQLEDEGHYGPIDNNEAFESRLNELAWADKMMIEENLH